MATQATIQAGAIVTVTIDGVSYGNWTTKSGGQIEADHPKTRLAGMGAEIVVKGLASRENVTVTRQLDDYLITKYKTLDAKAREGAPMSVSNTWMVNVTTTLGDSITYSGLLSRVTLPEVDSGSDDIAFMELEMVANEVAA